MGRDIEQIYAGSNKGVLADVDLLQQITEACRSCVREFVRDRTGLDGRIGTNWLAALGKSLGISVDPWVRALQGTAFAGAPARARAAALLAPPLSPRAHMRMPDAAASAPPHTHTCTPPHPPSHRSQPPTAWSWLSCSATWSSASTRWCRTTSWARCAR